MGKINNFRWIIFVLMLSVLGCNSEKTDMIIVIDGQTKVYSEYPESGMPRQEKVITVLGKGVKCKVVTIRYSKDFQFYKIELQDGREGYIIFGDNFRVLSRERM